MYNPALYNPALQHFPAVIPLWGVVSSLQEVNVNVDDLTYIAAYCIADNVQIYHVAEASRVCCKMSATCTGMTSKCAVPRKPSTARNCAICPAVTKYIAMAALESVSSAASAHTICIRLEWISCICSHCLTAQIKQRKRSDSDEAMHCVSHLIVDNKQVITWWQQLTAGACNAYPLCW